MTSLRPGAGSPGQRVRALPLPAAGRRRWLAASALLAAPVAALTACRAVDVPWPPTVVQLLSFTPWLVLPAGFSLLCAVAARRPLAVTVAASLLAVQVAWLFAPGHASASRAAGLPGVDLVTMSINAKLGRADADGIVRLVRENGVGLLAVQEYTPALEARLEAAGISALLPHRISAPAGDASGGALYSRHPLAFAGNLPGTRFPMATARLELPGPGGTAVVHVTNVHTRAPVDGGLTQWRRELALLTAEAGRTGAGGTPDGTGVPVLLVGDFNAGYDHAEFRRLVSGRAGNVLVDVATDQGARLVPTWPRDLPLPGTTLDHLVTGSAIGSRGYAVHSVDGTDHAAVLATLRIPARA